MNIERNIYLERLKCREGNHLVKVITGIRRCGKSYLLFRIFRKYLLDKGIPADHIIEIEFDRRRNTSLRNPDNACKYIDERLKDGNLYYLLLDEVQLLDDFEAVLNDYLHYDNVDIYVTGSNSRFLSTDVLTEFSGRGDEIHVFPLSFSEFCSAYAGPQAKAWQEYLLYGGLPLVLSQTSETAKTGYLKKLFEETYFVDVTKRHHLKKNPEELEELMQILASAVGSLTNTLKLANTFHSEKHIGISRVTLNTYCRYFQEAFLLHKAKRYDIKGKKYINSQIKYYFEDIGLRNALLNFRQIEETHLMENIIYNELRLRGYNVDVGVVEQRHAETEHQKLEVDFVANLGSKRIYIQSAFNIPDEAKRMQEIRPFMNIKDAFRRMVITGNNTPTWRDDNGIVTMNIVDFLLDQNSLDI